MRNAKLLWLTMGIAIAIMLLTPGMYGAMFFSLFLFIGFLVLFGLYLNSLDNDGSCAENSETPTGESEEQIERIEKIANTILDVSGSKSKAGILAYEGALLVSAEEGIEHLSKELGPTGREFFIEDADMGEKGVVILPEGSTPTKSTEAKKPRYGIHAVLFIATFGTTTWAGAVHKGIDFSANPGSVLEGVPYSLALMLILGAHEMGHYLTARRYKIDVTLPYFIPVPFALGTFGAFISMKSPPTSRRSLFDVAIAGPIAGLAVAIPALLVGLPLSTLVPGNAEVGMMEGGASLGSSILFALLAKLAIGTSLSEAHNIILHPLAFAGWLGLLLTALNLLPIGQLDGGHIARSLFGTRKAAGLSNVAMAVLFFTAFFVWPAILFFAVLVFLVAGRSGIPPKNDVTKLSIPRLALGFSAFTLLALIIIPLPHGWYESFGLHCPYL